jgi:hypothetical protein
MSLHRFQVCILAVEQELQRRRVEELKATRNGPELEGEADCDDHKHETAHTVTDVSSRAAGTSIWQTLYQVNRDALESSTNNQMFGAQSEHLPNGLSYSQGVDQFSRESNRASSATTASSQASFFPNS